MRLNSVTTPSSRNPGNVSWEELSERQMLAHEAARLLILMKIRYRPGWRQFGRIRPNPRIGRAEHSAAVSALQ